MSVLACNRYGCENIMCGRCSPKYGYLCGECFEELVKRGPDANIVEFMGQEKNLSNPYSEAAARARFEAEFTMREQRSKVC